VSQGGTVKRYLSGGIQESYTDITLCWDRQFSGSAESSDIALSKLDIEIYEILLTGQRELIAADPDTTAQHRYNTKMIRQFRIPRADPPPGQEQSTVEIRVIGASVDAEIGGGTGSQRSVLACNQVLNTTES